MSMTSLTHALELCDSLNPDDPLGLTETEVRHFARHPFTGYKLSSDIAVAQAKAGQLQFGGHRVVLIPGDWCDSATR